MKVLLKGPLLMPKLFRKYLVGTLGLSFCFAALQAQAEFVLSGEIKQGGLIVGKALPGSSAKLNDKQLKLSTQGDFIFGFSRDDETTYQLVVTEPNGQSITRVLKPAKRQYKIDRVEGIAKKIMQPDPKNVARAAKDRKQVKNARALVSELTDFAHGFDLPRKSKVTGVYGSQRFYNGKAGNPHYGVDYRGKVGDPVNAPAGGIVTLWVPDMFYSGGTLIIDHGFGVNSTFLHLSKAHVKVGQRIEKGQLIAAVGQSGRVSGPHLDWRINWFNVRIDPSLALKIKPL